LEQAPRDPKEQALYDRALRLALANRFAVGAGGFLGPFPEQGEAASPAFLDAQNRRGRNSFALRAGQPPLPLGVLHSASHAAAASEGAHAMAVLPRKERTRDALPPTNTGPHKPNDPLDFHQCSKCLGRFGVGSLDKTTGLPYRNGNPRHWKCPAAHPGNKTTASPCWGPKKKDTGTGITPACPGCWPFGRDACSVPSPPAAAAAAAKGAAVAAEAAVTPAWLAAKSAEDATPVNPSAAAAAKAVYQDVHIAALALRKAATAATEAANAVITLESAPAAPGATSHGVPPQLPLPPA